MRRMGVSAAGVKTARRADGEGTIRARTGRAVRLLTVVCLALGGCGESRPASTTQPATEAVVRTAEAGHTRLTVQLERGRVGIAEPVHLWVEVEAPPGAAVTMPAFDRTLGDFEVWNTRQDPPVLAGNVTRWRQECTIAALESGRRSIPPIRVQKDDGRITVTATTQPASQPGVESATTQPAEPDTLLATEPITVEVTPLLAADHDPRQYRDIKGPVDVPTERRWVWLAWSGAAAVALLIAALALVLYRRRQSAKTAKPISPDAWAFEQLRLLEMERLVQQGLLSEFYFRLSGIVREYIERRFGLMAPERTTDEFLQEVRESEVLSGSHKNLLREFLQAADLVKFARYEPSDEEIDRALGTARDFVEQTSYAAALRQTEIAT